MTAGGEDDRLGMEDVKFASRQLDGDDASRRAVHGQQIEDLKLIKEIYFVLNALLVKSLQDHVPGAVGSIAGAAHRFSGDVIGVAAKRALCDAAIRRAGERQTQ